MIEKNKNLFIITLEDNKKTYYDFATKKYYGVSGKTISKFGTEAKKVLSENKYNNFLAYYFNALNRKSDYYSANKWEPSMVETIYSLYNEKYESKYLIFIANFCHLFNYKLDKQGVKLLSQALLQLQDETGKRLNYFTNSQLNTIIYNLKYQNVYSQKVIDLIAFMEHRANKNIYTIFRQDIDKIAFRYEHENWEMLENGFVGEYIIRYITLCELLHKERTYKNLFLSLCLMENEKFLLNEKLCNDYQLDAPLFYENNNFITIIPTTAKQFEEEANYQQNCVFNAYFPKVQNLKTHIVFIRRKEDTSTPYITCEVSNTGKIVQYLKRFNHNVTDKEALNFRKEYQNYLNSCF